MIGKKTIGLGMKAHLGLALFGGASGLTVSGLLLDAPGGGRNVRLLVIYTLLTALCAVGSAALQGWVRQREPRLEVSDLVLAAGLLVLAVGLPLILVAALVAVAVLSRGVEATTALAEGFQMALFVAVAIGGLWGAVALPWRKLGGRHVGWARLSLALWNVLVLTAFLLN